METESFEKESPSNLASTIIFIVAAFVILAAAFLFIDRVRADARRNVSINNLKELALSCLKYESAHEHLPSAQLPLGPSLHDLGWEVRIAPFCGSTICNGNVTEKLHERWNNPDNKELFSCLWSPFQSPHTNELYDSEGYSLSHYSATLETIPPGKPKTLKDLDPNKEMFGEIAAGYQPWPKPGNSRTIGNGIWFDKVSFGNPEYNGVCFAYVDGSVRYQVLDYDRR